MEDNNTIRDKVFSFYAKNRQRCDRNYMLAEDENIYKIYDDVSSNTEKNSLFTRTSIVLLTANKYERNILHKRIHLLTKKNVKRIEIELLTASDRFNKAYAYWFEWNDYSILHIHANMTGSYTIAGSADVTKWILSNKYLYPGIIISFGVCFGTNENKNELGDVIIAKKVYPYFIGAKLNGDDLHVVDDNVFAIDSDLYNKIKDLKNNNVFNKLHFHVYFENYITGEAVVSSQNERDKYTNITTQEVYAGEMEGYGLFKECKSSKFNVPCMVLKSICDWGTDKNFNENDKNVLIEFSTKISQKSSATNDIEEDIKLLKSLKDRIQAFSANCAFDALEVIINREILDKAMFDRLRSYILTYKGLATTCKKLRETTCDIARNLKFGYTLSECFIHRCLMLLEEEGLIQCDIECISDYNEQDNCNQPTRDASIEIKQEKN